MAARHDILDRQESLRNPLLGSVGFHTALFATMLVYAMLPHSERMPWGDPNALGGGSVTITPVSKIPIPPRAGRVNPLANDTQSQVPAPPPKPKAQPKQAAREDPEAIAIKSRKPAKKTPARRSSRRTTGKPAPERSNQLYNPGGAAANSPMFGSTSGSGGVGVGPGGAFGGRFGYYVEILRQKVASRWNTGQVDPRLQTAPPVIVAFEIARDGSARNVRFLQRSGNSTLDYSAQRAVLEASPFPPLPRGFERNSALIEFWFQLKR
jgi:protein TonB